MIRKASIVGLVCALALLSACKQDSESAPASDGSARTTVTLAFLDDPSRRAALYAIDNALVTSDSIDIVATYVSQSALNEALGARQYDVVETASLAVPGSVEGGADLVVLSAGRLDKDGTLLFVRADGAIDSVADLRGEKLGVSSLDGPPALKTRHLLQERDGMDVQREGGDLTYIEAPAQSLSGILRNGDATAAAMQDLSAYLASNDGDFRVLANVSEEASALPNPPLLDTVLVTYRDVATQKNDALVEVDRLLAESLAYFQANRERILADTAAAEGVDSAYLEWWWDHAELPLGDLSSTTQQQLLDTWEATKAVGDIETYPELAGLLFQAEK
ncbi:MAG: PhnD/SsuA/transferrin family substrate-binding protein [Dehalococcoidia bacterium]